MSKQQPPKVRLATGATAASEVFNFYQIISLLSGLYIKGAERQNVDDLKNTWDFASDSLLAQVGDAYDLWMAVQTALKDGLSSKDNQELIARTTRLAQRIVLLESHLNLWSPTTRWGRILSLVERRLMMLTEQIADHHPHIADKLADMREDMDRRQGSMMNVHAAAMHEAQDLNRNYAIPVAI